MLLLLYRFRHKNGVTGKWVTARYRAEIPEIERTFGKEYELLDVEVREPSGGGSFNPYPTERPRIR